MVMMYTNGHDLAHGYLPRLFRTILGPRIAGYCGGFSFYTKYQEEILTAAVRHADRSV